MTHRGLHYIDDVDHEPDPGSANVGEPGATGEHAARRETEPSAGRLVESPPASPLSYEAYLRARLALEFGDLQTAAQEIEFALSLDPRDPQLWTTRAEIARLRGDEVRERESLDRALKLRPGYTPALELRED